MTLGTVTSSDKQKSKAKCGGILCNPSIWEVAAGGSGEQDHLHKSSQPAWLPETLSFKKFADQIPT